MSVLNFGSLNIDIFFEVDNFVKPGETKNAVNSRIECGGKGLNQSIAAACAGVKVFHAGKAGTGSQMLLNKLKKYSVDTRYIFKSKFPNAFAGIEVDKNGENGIICSGGTNHMITEKEIDEVLSNFGESDYLLLQNEINSVGYIIKRAKERGMKIAVNLAPFTEEAKTYPLELCDYLIINETEGNGLTGDKEPEKIVAKLSDRFCTTAVVLTLGSKGWMLKDGGKIVTQPSYDVKAEDTTGAGDVFTGFFLAGIIAGKTKGEAADFASKAAALSVTQKGSSESIPTKEQVENSNLKLKNNLIAKIKTKVL